MEDGDAIRAALTGFDGRHVAGLRALVRRGLSAAGVAAVMDEVPGPLETPASWVLKALAETGALGRDEVAGLYLRLPDLTDTDALLHVLQLVQRHPAAARPVRDAIAALTSHKTLLVRVWAFDALCRTTPPDGTAERDARIRATLSDPSKAMQARARALAREFGLDPASKG